MRCYKRKEVLEVYEKKSVVTYITAKIFVVLKACLGETSRSKNASST